MSNQENRCFTHYAELRAATDELALEGYAARFNSLSRSLGSFKEKILPGAFTRVLAGNPDVVCNLNHGMKTDMVLGRTTAGTLTLTQDDKGLHFRCQLDPAQVWHRDLQASVSRTQGGDRGRRPEEKPDPGGDRSDRRDRGRAPAIHKSAARGRATCGRTCRLSSRDSAIVPRMAIVRCKKCGKPTLHVKPPGYARDAFGPP